IVGELFGPLIAFLMTAALAFVAVVTFMDLKWADYNSHQDEGWYNKQNVGAFAVDLGAAMLKATVLLVVITTVLMKIPGAGAVGAGTLIGGAAGIYAASLISLDGLVQQDAILGFNDGNTSYRGGGRS